MRFAYKNHQVESRFTNYLPSLTINVVAAKLMIKTQRKTDVSLLTVYKSSIRFKCIGRSNSNVAIIGSLIRDV